MKRHKTPKEGDRLYILYENSSLGWGTVTVRPEDKWLELGPGVALDEVISVALDEVISNEQGIGISYVSATEGVGVRVFRHGDKHPITGEVLYDPKIPVSVSFMKGV